MLTGEDNEIIYFMQDVYESLDDIGNRAGILNFFKSSKEEQLKSYGLWKKNAEKAKIDQLLAQKDSLQKQIDDINKVINNELK